MQAVPSSLGRHSADAVFERMRTYANALERTSPLVFVGRQNELATLRDATELTATDNPRGMTQVVQGVPGTGKSSLCERFITSVHGCDAGGRVALCAKMDPGDLDAPPLRFVAALTEELRRTHARLAGASGRIAAGRRHAGLLVDAAGQLIFRTGEHRLNAKAHGLTDQSPLSACLNAHADHMWPNDVVIVLAFDEMQSCPITTRAATALRILNECLHDARILVACFGLQNTADLMRDDLGLSRIPADAIMELGPLNPGEGREVLERTLDHLGLSANNEEWRGHVQATGVAIESWTDWRERLINHLDDASFNFPQHLTAALRATCQALCRSRDASAMDPLLAEIAELHRANKADYYQKRIGGALSLHRTALGAVAQAADENGGLSKREAVKAFMAGDDEGEAMERDAARAVVDLAIARGVLRLVEVDDELCCGPPSIPSMTQHLIDRYARKLGRGDPIALTLADSLGLNLPPPDDPPHEAT